VSGAVLVGGDDYKALLQIVDRAGILVVKAVIELTAYSSDIMPAQAVMVDEFRLLRHLNSHHIMLAFAAVHRSVVNHPELGQPTL